MATMRTSRVVALLALSFASLVGTGAIAHAAQDGVDVRRNGIAVLDLDTGKELWIERPLEEASYLGAVPGRHVVVATLGTCDSGLDALYSQGLVAFDAATGRKRWSNSSTDFVLATVRPMATYVFAVVPVDAGGMVVTASDAGVLRAYNAKDGTIAWTRAADDAPIGVTEASAFATNRDEASANTLRVLNRRTGRVRWEHDLQGQFEVVAADERWVVVATGNVRSQPPSEVKFVVLDARTGSEKSRFDAGHPEGFSFSEVALHDGQLDYAQRSSVVSRALSNGAQNWRTKVDRNPGALIMARGTDNKTVYALRGGSVGRVVALDATTGRERWTNTGYLPAAGDTTAVLGRNPPPGSNALRGVDAISGASKWRYDVPDIAPGGTSNLRIRSAGGRLVMSTECNIG